MTVQVSYPGVYIQEVSSGVRTITGVSTSIALFVGMTQRGPLESAERILSFAAYERAFGTDTTVSEMTDQVRQFFLNGGRQAFVIRIADDDSAIPAEAELENEAGVPVLRVTAAEPGRIGDSIRVEIRYDTAQPETTFTLVAGRETADAAGNLVIVEAEVFADLTMDPGAGRFVETVLEQSSRLIRAERIGAPPTIQGYSMSGRAEGAGQWIAALNAQLAGGTGSFAVSVDGGPSGQVTLTAPVADAPAIQQAIEAAVGAGSVAVGVVPFAGGPEEVLVVQSTTAGGSVRITPGAAGDLAAPMMLGTANDGLEIGGHATARPAPTGLFAALGNLDIGTTAVVNGDWLGRLGTLARTDQADLPDIDVATGIRTDSYTIVGLTAGTPFWEATPGTEPRLRTLRTRLQAVQQSIAGTAGANYDAEIQGFRLVLQADFPGAAEQEAAAVTTSGGYGIDTPATGIFGVAPSVRRVPLGTFAAPANYVTGTAAGADGDLPGPDDYDRAYRLAAREIDLFNLLVLPRVLSDQSGNAQGDAERAPLWGPASVFCRDSRAFLIIDPRADWTDADAAVAGIGTVRTGAVGDHAAVFWPRLRIADAQTGLLKTIDPAGTIAGVAARIDGSRGVWKAPAGLETGLRGVRALERTLSDAESGILNPQAINAHRRFPNGIVVWGSRTLSGFDNSGNSDYRYVPVRRVALFIEESLYRGLQFAVFEPNDEPLWAQIRLAAGAFMNGLFRRGAFQGARASDAYFVKCDAETTTQNDINLGIVNVVIGFAPLRPAEFVVIQIRQLAGQVQT
ncbi:MAG: phage tail sheath C-terminal domain-containing protein [Pseudomonadota bacterium]